ncbi:hypothetical protein N7539_004300 [Penicillium diatomitis]|uniref:Uncharacterized protein n=1 Tax=Penicillium diatomitis TaxID=2819901 RepID=A0A9W9XDK3_9EURO|nr:uncharacterized protein N7539_004300 [Penicillium diatomitis]KAJ5489410.1 hypothetical protein N7539_004300 [Penicillium diatomitis]
MSCFQTVGYLLERKHCFLESPEWKTLPWAKCGLDAKLPIEELQDLLCDLPGQLEDVDKILTWEKDELSKAALHSALCSRIFATLSKPFTLADGSGSRCFRVAHTWLSPCDLVHRPIPCPRFDDIQHHSVDCYTDHLKRSACMLATRCPIDLKMTPFFLWKGQETKWLLKYCRMVDYHMHSLRRSSGAFMLIFPLNVAHLHLDQDTGEIKTWLEAVMAVVADYHGFEVGRRENMPRQLHPSKR